MAKLACSPPGANAPAKRRGYWTKFRQIFVTRSGVIGVNACIHVANCDPPFYCGMPAHKLKVGYANFRLFEPKSVTIATSLERSRKECLNDHAHSCTHPENLVRIGSAHSEIIIGLQGSVKSLKKVTSAVHNL